MLYTLVVVLSVLAWRIQAQNGTSSEIIGNFTSMDQGELGSSENESEDLTTAFSSELESTSSGQLTTTRGRSQVNEGSMSITVEPLQILTLPNDGSIETRQTSFTEVNGLADISNESTVTEGPNESPESEDSDEDDSDEKLSLGSSRSDSGKKGDLAGMKDQLRGKRETSKKGSNFPLGGTNLDKGNQVTEMNNQPRTSQPLISEEINDITVTQAFSVGLFGQYQLPINGTPIRFQTIFFNEAELYNITSGKFVAERSGIYSLTYSVIYPLKPHQIDLIVNGIPYINNISGMWDEYNSASLILRLRAGDEIWFEAVSVGQKRRYSIMFTFSGFLLSR